ncbi:uncharacterized protein LOC125858916 [Solanum stenotomum]|uniref:uncharacterized protein LOC125858916 n=1 Tax=Solanum stenotomum TaxID=172797 RepID=UPI0020D03482|nr:uncharacterized protein LOC125858916 [Solanum stenotomum]
MSNLSKLEFMALDISGKNYLSWLLDVEIHLIAKGDSIIEGSKASSQDKEKAMIFLRHHIDESLKVEYLTVKDPLELWIGLKGRYDHLKATVLPRARYEWMYLQFQDYKTVIEYNSVVFRITSQLKLCGEVIKDEDMLEKTLTTFHASNMILQQQYREKGFKKYYELISFLLVAEQINDFLMKNHEIRPVGSAPLSEAHGVEEHGQFEIRQNNRGHDNVRGRGKGKRRYNNHRGGGHNKRENNMSSQNNPSKGKGDHCHRCGLKGSSQKYDENVKANLALKDDAFDGLDDITHLEAIWNIANQLSNTFTNLPWVAKLYIPVANIQVRVDVPIGQNVKANEFGPRLKRGRPIGSKDKNLRKRKEINGHDVEAIAHEELRDIINYDTTKEVHVPENNENE